jgi:DNA-binding NarL/FixJ family response regulator
MENVKESQKETKQGIRILLVDDHEVVRDGLQHMLSEEKDIEIVGQGADAEEALFMAEVFSPDVILMDIKMPGVDGIELTRKIKKKRSSCNIIMLTLYNQYLNQALQAGASGYLLKDIKHDELAQAIRRVHQGEVVISEEIASQPPNGYEEKSTKKPTGESALMINEIQLVIPPPVDAGQLMRFVSRVEEMLWCRVMQVVGSWQEGTIMTITLDGTTPLADILDKLKEIPEIEAAGEEAMATAVNPGLLKKATAIPTLRNKTRKTILLTFEKN